MNRRNFFTTTIALGAGLTSGCFNSGGSSGTPTATKTKKSNSPSTTETQETGYSLPSTVSIEDPLSEITFGQMMVKKYFRYYDEEAESIKKLYPNRSFWIEATISTTNLGDEGIKAISQNSIFMFGKGGEESPALTSPHTISWDQIRLREKYKAYWLEPGYLGSDTISPGDSLLAYILFDVNDAKYPGVKIDSGRFGQHKLHPESVFVDDTE